MSAAVVYGRVITTEDDPVAGVHLTVTADQLGQCPAEEVFYGSPPPERVVSNSQGFYRAVVLVETDALETTCVWVLADPPAESMLSEATANAGPIRFGNPPLDSLRVDVVLPSG